MQAKKTFEATSAPSTCNRMYTKIEGMHSKYPQPTASPSTSNNVNLKYHDAIKYNLILIGGQ